MSDRPKPYMGQVMAECDCQHYGCVNRGYCMADRIEALVKERDKAALWATEQHACADNYALRLGQEKARAERLEAALHKLHHAVCGETGFAACVRLESGKAYPWPALDEADAAARAALKGDDQ